MYWYVLPIHHTDPFLSQLRCAHGFWKGLGKVCAGFPVGSLDWFFFFFFFFFFEHVFVPHYVFIHACMHGNALSLATIIMLIRTGSEI